MTRRKIRRARVSRNAFARRAVQRTRGFFDCAADVRRRWPVALWVDAGCVALRGPEQRRSLRALHRDEARRGYA